MILYLLAGPSASGKSTICEWIDGDERLALPVITTCTSRPRRPTEVDGKHFHFKQPGEIEAMNDRGELFEFAVNHGNAYGTPWSFLPTSGDALVVFDIGAAMRARLKLLERMNDDRGVVIFLEPMGGLADLRPRLVARGASEQEIVTRLATAYVELKRKEEADYIVPCWQDSLSCVYQDVLAIVRAERLHT